MTRARLLAAPLLLALALTGCGGGSSHPSNAAGTKLSGVFGISRGACTTAAPTGSFFRMVTPAGTFPKGPYVANADSPCRDKTVTPLEPGTSGGLRVGSYQAQPTTVFVSGGNAASAAIVAPTSFFAVKFGVSTNPKDPQTGVAVPAPTATRDGNTLHADLRAWSVAWNGQQFNQGAPKPDAGGVAASGTIDPATGAYTLDWTSRIKGGPFNGFTGVWHLTGTFHSA